MKEDIYVKYILPNGEFIIRESNGNINYTFIPDVEKEKLFKALSIKEEPNIRLQAYADLFLTLNTTDRYYHFEKEVAPKSFVSKQLTYKHFNSYYRFLLRIKRQFVNLLK